MKTQLPHNTDMGQGVQEWTEKDLWMNCERKNFLVFFVWCNLGLLLLLSYNKLSI